MREDTRIKQRLFAEAFLAEGIVTHIPERDPSYEERRYPPIIVEGEPVSETVI